MEYWQCEIGVVEKLDEAVGQFSVSCRIGMRGTIRMGFLVCMVLMWIGRKG